jgi:hypothetical protein
LISLKKVAELPILAARPLFTKPVTFRPSLATGLAFSEYINNVLMLMLMLNIQSFFKKLSYTNLLVNA